MQYRSHRYPTEYPVQLCSPGGSLKAKIVNVHAAGAKIQVAAPLLRGDRVSFQILSTPVHGIVLWSARGHIGVTFRPELTMDQVDTLRQRRDSRNVHRPGQVGFRFAEMR